MIRISLFLSIIFLSFKPPSSVSSDLINCIVIYFPSDCDYFICKTANDDFLLLEWYGGDTPDKGDILYGDFYNYGFKNIYNRTKKKKSKVWIEDYMLSKEDVFEKYLEKCD